MNPKTVFETVRPDVQLAKLEEEILEFWEREKIFEKSLSRVGAKKFSFYDGPPFATGLPHYGHILCGVLKDVVPRFWTMQGYQVARRFGWDCHGLPVEYEINKSLKLESRKAILEYGVDRYNQACRSIVTRYSEEWKKTVRRTGRWVDMDQAYFTMDLDFMQSVWNVFQKLWDMGLIYEGYKVVPYSVGLSTALSNFEANLNYKQVQDPAITVQFRLLSPGHAQEAVLAWTTTPWTLPSNMALAVHREMTYVLLEVEGQKFWIEPSRAEVYGWKDAPVLKTVLGRELVGCEYEPVFSDFLEERKNGAFRIIHSDHVTSESGTGVVHMAPAFGEEDFYACQAAKIPMVNPVDDDGMFTSQILRYQGRRVKETDREWIAELKKSGRLVKHETYEHSYPYCWRTDTPLIYRAVSSWFVAVEKIKDRMIAANQKTHWVPEHLRDGRFGKWLENARDWAISRNRFWGTPLPIWRNEEGEVLCVGSAAELEKLTGKKVTDLHMEFVDQLEIPSPTGKSPLRRIEPVLDCWFESGSMPYAQWGYPFRNEKEFQENFPAQFIAEGLDQTRGWFYTLTVIGAALFGKSPFQNVIVNGLVLAEDGKKMSKSLRNYPDPMEVLNRHGADALRLYMIDSPVVKAEELKFSEKGVVEIIRRILLRWWNAYGFFVNYANVDHYHPDESLRTKAPHTTNPLDRWLLSRLHRLIETTDREMRAYRIYQVVPELLQFIEELTNTYIRFNRSHFWREGMPEDKKMAYDTLYYTLSMLSKIMAPFAPFMSEATYRNLSRNFSDRAESVHLEKFPIADPSLIHSELEQAVSILEALTTQGRNAREKLQIRGKIPLKLMKVIHRDPKVLEFLRTLEPYYSEELNVRKVEYDSDEDAWVKVSVKPNFPVLGKRMGAKMKSLSAAIGKLSLAEILKLERGESLLIEGESLVMADLLIDRAPKKEREDLGPSLQVGRLVSLWLDPVVEEEQIREGLAREVLRKVQAARKNAGLKLDDRIRLELFAEGALLEAIRAHQGMIETEALVREFQLRQGERKHSKLRHQENVELDEGTIGISLEALSI
jgi:isoleucyl-tRNA synthetase